ncbi:MAG: hypothetical protein JW726_10780 [Anaerolineales bacterium]|nr:hypothetical protein [Anaerolineales bacterium]
MKKNFGFLAMLFVLTLAILACGGSSPTLPAGVLFQDDFSSSSSGWDTVRVDDGITDYENGVYRILVNTTQMDVWANPGLNFSDVRVEVEATKVGGVDDNDFGVICRYQDESNFYYGIISSDGYYGIAKVKDASQELLGMTELPYSDAIAQGNALNTIRLDCVGSTLTLYVNGTQLAQQSDSEWSSGDVGLIAGTYDTPGTDIHFDNFKVLQP